jgi:photosystem II stability/assembly factor-like uncharacterized protein/thiol-disulfide isomerase/thioredoxin
MKYYLLSAGALLALGCSHPKPVTNPKAATSLPTSETSFVREGDPLPTFALKTLDNQTMRSDELTGKVVLINFWASYCGPCKDEFPALETLHKTYEEKGLVVLGISIDDTPNDSVRVAQQYGLSFPNLYGGESLYRSLGGKGTPFSILIEKDTIIAKISGRRSEDFFEGLVWSSLSLNPRSRIGAVQPKAKPNPPSAKPPVAAPKPLAKEANGWKLEGVSNYGGNFGALSGVRRNNKDRVLLGGMGALFYSDGDGVWKTSHQDPTTFMFTGFGVASADEIYAVGDDSPILFSSDGGETWKAVSARYALVAVWVSPDGVVYASGDKGLFLQSTDKGKTWQKIDLGVTVSLTSIWGASASDIYVGGAFGLLFHSTDKGKTWQKIDTKQEGALVSIWGQSADEVYAVGGYHKGVILRSTDRGKTWSITEKGENYLGTVLGIAPGEIWISGSSKVFRSRDKGNTWEEIPTIPDAPVLYVWGSKEGAIYAVGPQNTILVKR